MSLHAAAHDLLVRVAPAVIDHLLVSTAVLVIALTVAAMPRLSGRTRFVVIVFGVLNFLLPAGAAVAVLPDQWRLLFQRPAPAPQVDVLPRAPDVRPIEAEIRRPSELYCAAAAIWLGGALAAAAATATRRHAFVRALGPLTSCGAREKQLLAAAATALRLRDFPPLSCSPWCNSPAVIGVLRQRIVLPQSLDSLSDAELHALLLHELVHLRRRDNGTAAVLIAICTVFWFHPLLWLAYRRALWERERAADEQVLSAASADDYLSGIVMVCRSGFTNEALGVAPMNPRRLQERMTYIMNFVTLRRSLWPHGATTIAAAVLLILLTLTGGLLTAEAVPTSSRYSLDVTLTEVSRGMYRCQISVKDAAGEVVAAPQLTVRAGERATASIESESRRVEIEVRLQSSESAAVALRVYEGGQLTEDQTRLVNARRPTRIEGSGGSPITLNLKDAQLADVVRTFSQLTGVEMTADEPLTGLVTVELNGIPWQAALETVLHQTGYTYRWVGEKAIKISRGAPIYRVGGDVLPPTVLSRVDPVYTPEARVNRVQGLVVIEAVIDESGTVRDTRVLKALPFGLDAAAVEAVRQWKFNPATRDGQAVPVRFNLTINFRLDD